jgi:hypothetical protein
MNQTKQIKRRQYRLKSKPGAREEMKRVNRALEEAQAILRRKRKAD